MDITIQPILDTTFDTSSLFKHQLPDFAEERYDVEYKHFKILADKAYHAHLAFLCDFPVKDYKQLHSVVFTDNNNKPCYAINEPTIIIQLLNYIDDVFWLLTNSVTDDLTTGSHLADCRSAGAAAKLDRSKVKRHDFTMPGYTNSSLKPKGIYRFTTTIFHSTKLNVQTIEDLLVRNLKKFISQNQRTTSKSYLEYWKKSNNIQTIIDDHVKIFDDAILNAYGDLSNLRNKIQELKISTWSYDDKTMYKADNFYDVFTYDDLNARNEWYDLIDDQVYFAILSRSRDKSSGKRAYAVSDKVIYDCLDKVCYNLMTLYHHYDIRKKIQDTSKVFKAFVDGIYEKVNYVNSNADSIQYITNQLFEVIASYVSKENASYDIDFCDISDDNIGEWLACDTSEIETFEYMFDCINSIHYDDPPEKLIAGLSKAIDQFHHRGSLAGVFIKGGARACSKASDMSPDELYETAFAHTFKYPEFIRESFRHLM